MLIRITNYQIKKHLKFSCGMGAMSKPRKKQGNPDFRHQLTCPDPTSEEIESRLIEYGRLRLHKIQNYNSLRRFVVEHQRSMGLVKAVCQQHRRNAARSLDIWAEALT